MAETKDLGLVKAIFEGTTPPTNTSVLWRDTSLTIPLLKQYNPTTSSWEALVYFTLIDNSTIKKDVDGKLYVDVTTIPALQIADGSITLAKLINFNSGTVLYRRSAGSGVMEATTLTQLKIDLGLTGTNSGDQDLSFYALKTYTINGKALSGNITLTPNDIGSPSGSGTSTGTNTGDETISSIKTKLGITILSGDNTGDQNASQVSITDTAEHFVATDVEGALAEVKQIADQNKSDLQKTPRIEEITLPAYSSVALRCSNAVEGVDYPTGWVLSADTNPVDLLIVHDLGRRCASVTISSVDGTTEQQLFGNAAYSSIYNLDSANQVRISALATIETEIVIHLLFS